MTIFSKNIRYLRKQKEWSQDYIAEKLGYKSYTTIQKWEMGTSEPPLKKLKELSDLFSVDIDDLTNKDFEHQNQTKPLNNYADPSNPINNRKIMSEEYYFNPETKKVAQEIFENKDLALLFDAAKDASPEDLQTVHTMLLALKSKERRD